MSWSNQKCVLKYIHIYISLLVANSQQETMSNQLTLLTEPHQNKERKGGGREGRWKEGKKEGKKLVI